MSDQVAERAISSLTIEQSLAEGYIIALDSGAVEGYAATWSYAGDGIKFLPGSFTKTLVERAGKIPLMVRHISSNGTLDEVVGAVMSGKQDDVGLYVTCEFMGDNKSQVAREYAVGKRARSFSIGARPVKYEMLNGIKLCSEAAIVDVILTDRPADKGAVVIAARSMEPTQVTPIVKPTQVTSKEDLIVRAKARIRLHLHYGE